jgi:FAD/FMN-containing dehydrogenase
MKRRTFLGGLGASLAACASPAAIESPTPTRSPIATPTPSPTVTPIPTQRTPDWAALRTALRGTLRMSSDPGYDDARLLYNTRFDGIRPLAVARCADERDVQTCVRFARDSGVPLRVRSGGHSYAGWSSGPGLVVDLRAMSSVTLAANKTTVGAGAQLIDVYDQLSTQGRGIGAGSCPTVGVSGLTLGGGVGVLTRAWGLTCDQLTAARVVLADGSVTTCDANNEPDLFWALRGGGGSFGAVTSLTFDTHPASDLALAFLIWPWGYASAVVAGWQSWIRDAPDGLWSTLHLEGGEGEKGVTTHSVYPARAAEIATEIDRLIRLVGRPPSYRESGARTYREVMLLEGGCLGRPVSACHLKGTTADGLLDRETYAASSIVARGFLSNGAIDGLVAGIERAAVGGASVLIDSLGGAVSRVAFEATAFPHRDAGMVLQLIASWQAGTTGDASLRWLADTTGVARKNIGSTDAYANYVEPDLTNWAAAYYGANYPRLQRVKRRYDPDRLFDFPQAVVPA